MTSYPISSTIKRIALVRIAMARQSTNVVVRQFDEDCSQRRVLYTGESNDHVRP